MKTLFIQGHIGFSWACCLAKQNSIMGEFFRSQNVSTTFPYSRHLHRGLTSYKIAVVFSFLIVALKETQLGNSLCLSLT